MPGEPAEKKVGRQVFNVSESQLWAQRICKEDKINASVNGTFSLRNAVSALDVPAKFKPGHVDPAQELRSLKRWEPADNGWDPSGPEAREFRRCLNSQTGGPRGFEAYPLTSQQEIGWLLSSAGAPGDRVRSQKCRYGFGWQDKHPSEWSASTACPPPVLARSSSHVSACAPASILSNSPPARESTLGLQPPAPSQLSRCPPPLPPPGAGGSELSSELSRASSVPAFMLHPVDRLGRREAKVSKVMDESTRYLNKGELGRKYAKPLNMTDVTTFDDDFCQANCGVPLFKTIGDQTVTLKDKFMKPCPRWK